MDIENIGAAAGSGGFVSAIMLYFGISSHKKQHEDLEKKQEDTDKRFERVVYKDTCNKCSEGIQLTLKSLDSKMDIVIERISR